MNITPYAKNAKKHPDSQLKLIAKSLREYGWRQPIIVDKNNVIIVGHGRWFAYQKYPEEIKEPWVIKADDLTPEQVREYRLMDNKTNESAWDMELAIEELKELNQLGFDIELMGFDKDLLVYLKEDNFDAQTEYNKIIEPKSKLGELYKLGEHHLLCGDSEKKETYEKLMNNEKAQMIFTDPPYNVGYDYTTTYVKGRTRKNKYFPLFLIKKTQFNSRILFKKYLKMHINIQKIVRHSIVGMHPQHLVNLWRV